MSGVTGYVERGDGWVPSGILSEPLEYLTGILMGGVWAARLAAPFAAGGVAERYVAAAAGMAGMGNEEDVVLYAEFTLDVLLA